ncbi:hypothetical protein [Nannocystis pusilla]|uniref:hypothetical protein n=1 Tax=Nannocystis pusilla TaxID=889268 RepID=UPI003BEFC92A
MSEWTVENIRFTLYNGERKERVIVQKSNGDLTVTSKQRDKDEDESRDDKAEKAPAAKEAGAGAKAAAQKPAQERKRKAGPPPPAAQQPASKGTALEWAPIVDAGYDGFAAKSHGAEIHVLNTTQGGWAIYVFWGRGSFKHITCHAELDEAKTAAQALHDKGLPPRPEPRLTQDMIDNACPAPQEGPPRPPRRTRAKQVDAGTGQTETTAQEAPPRPPRKPRGKKQADDAAGETETKPTEGPTELTPELRTELRDSFKDAMVEALKQAG